MHFSSFFFHLKLEAIPKLIWSFAPFLSLISSPREMLLIDNYYHHSLEHLISKWENSISNKGESYETRCSVF